MAADFAAILQKGPHMRALLLAVVLAALGTSATTAHAFLKDVQKQYGGTYSSSHIDAAVQKQYGGTYSSSHIDAAQNVQVKRILASRAAAAAEARARAADEGARAGKRAKQNAIDAISKYICIKNGTC